MATATIVTSVITGGVNNAATTSEQANAYATDFVSQGLVGALGNTSGVAPSTGAYAVNQSTSPAMTVDVTAGVAYITVTPSSQGSQVLRTKMSATSTGYVINANASGSTKFDWIYLSVSATNAANPAVGADNVTALFTSRSTSVSTDTGTPPTYGFLLAVVTVANGASSITNANIADRRTQSTLSNGSQASTDGWQVLNYPLSYASNSGGKEFTFTSPNDLTATLSVGMKIRVARSITPPTQSMAFVAASSQYATKASPSGITFTGPFACEAWIYLNSYTGNPQYIVNRLDGAGTGGGWAFDITSTGQVEIYYGTGSNFTNFVSYRAVPLKQWVHVVGVVTSVSSKTGVIYMNATAVPSTSTLSSSTTLTQASVDLRLGTASATPSNKYFDGYMSEVRVWSATRTAQNIQDNMAVNLVGNESNLAALYQGNGVFTDATSNSNTLIANAGAAATQASNPLNAVEYLSVVALSYSVPTTTVTVRAKGQNTLPNQTLNNPYYSTAASPYGLPLSLQTGDLSRVIVAAPQTTSGATDLNGYTSTFTVPTNISTLDVLVELSATSSVSNTQFLISLVDGSTTVKSWYGYTYNGTNIFSYVWKSTIPTTPGAHTYKLSFSPTGSNITTIALNGGATGIYGEMVFRED